MIKRTLLTLVALSMSFASHAGTMGPVCTPGSVTVPCPDNKWDLGIQGLYLQPVYGSSRGYELGTNGEFRTVDTDFGWGYRIEGSYHFNTGNDIRLNWLHYDIQSNVGGFSGSYLQLLPPAGATLIPTTYAGFLDNRFNQVNLLMSQHVDMSARQSSRFYAGAQYADVKVNRTNYYQVPAIFLEATEGVRGMSNADFNGFGPSLGVDYFYSITPAFSVIANAAASLLYGSARADISAIYGNGLVVGSVYGSKKQVIPEWEVKLGANYAYPFAHGVLNIEGGYQAINYLDALPTLVTSGLVSTLTTSDFGMYGPYIGVKWLGNA